MNKIKNIAKIPARGGSKIIPNKIPIPIISKLAIGSVQFGLDYGISNKKGKVNKDDVTTILDFARSKEIKMIDTAKAYGVSEAVLGLNSLYDFNVITKLSILDNYEKDINDSLDKLNIEKLYGLLVHDFSVFKQNEELYLEMYNSMSVKIGRIGFSLNLVSELNYLLQNDIKFDIVQVPYNLLDQRFDKYFSLLKEMGIEIHVRSVFLQGLFFLEKLPANLKGLGLNYNLIKKISKENKIPLNELALNFVLSNKYIDNVIVGVTNVEQLKDNIDLTNNLGKVNTIYPSLLNVANNDESLILPMNWK